MKITPKKLPTQFKKNAIAKRAEKDSKFAFSHINSSRETLTEEQFSGHLKSNLRNEVIILHLLVIDNVWENFGYSSKKAFLEKHIAGHYTTALRNCNHYEMTYGLRANPSDFKNFTANSMSSIFSIEPRKRFEIISQLTDGFDDSKFKNVTSTSVKKKAIELGYLSKPVKTSEHEKIKKQFTEYFIKQNKPITLVNFLQEALTENQLKQLIRKLQQVQR